MAQQFLNKVWMFFNNDSQKFIKRLYFEFLSNIKIINIQYFVFTNKEKKIFTVPHFFVVLISKIQN